MDDGDSDRKNKGPKECIIKRIIRFIDYKHCMFKNEVILKSQTRLKSESHDVYTEEINSISLCSNDDKSLQTFDNIRSYSYRANAFRVYESETLRKYKLFILMIIKMKTKQNIILSDHIFQIIHTEY